MQTRTIQTWPGGASYEYRGDPDGPAEQKRLRKGHDRAAKWRKGTAEEWTTIRTALRAVAMPRKYYVEQHNIGATRYSVSYHDGEQCHGDGSPFYGIRIFRNRRAMRAFVRDLQANGYTDTAPAEREA